ncbi:MAG TPA: hypothetical protein VMW19_11030, partial [Myxococcota bacterium]|nr:hypothetical protein [Myxococcota bacterium]
ALHDSNISLRSSQKRHTLPIRRANASESPWASLGVAAGSHRANVQPIDPRADLDLPRIPLQKVVVLGRPALLLPPLTPQGVAPAESSRRNDPCGTASA